MNPFSKQYKLESNCFYQTFTKKESLAFFCGWKKKDHPSYYRVQYTLESSIASISLTFSVNVGLGVTNIFVNNPT